MALATMTIDPTPTLMTGEEVRDALISLADADRLIVISRPGAGKHKVYAHNVDAEGNLEIEYDDVAES